MNPTNKPRTLLEIAGVSRVAARWSTGTLVIIDAQEFYRTGELALPGIVPAVAEARRVLDAARTNGAPVVHVVQQGRAGSSVFSEEACRILVELTPVEGEEVISKAFPDSFEKTNLEATLRGLGRTDLVMIGYMTHMCLSTSVRTAMHRGFNCTVVAGACATRDLPDSVGVMSADLVHRAELAALADRFACIVPGARQILP